MNGTVSLWKRDGEEAGRLWQFMTINVRSMTLCVYVTQKTLPLVVFRLLLDARRWIYSFEFKGRYALSNKMTFYKLPALFCISINSSSC